MAGAHSGRNGIVDNQETVRNWTINDIQVPQNYVASGSKYGTGRLPGIQDWSGSFAQYKHTPLALPGEALTFLGYTSPDSDILAGTGTTYGGAAIVDSIVISWDWTAGGILNTVVNFSGNGPLVASDAAVAIADASVPDVDTTVGTKIEIDTAVAPVSFATWPNLMAATLTITSANQAFANSSSAGWMERLPGILDFNLSVTEQETKRTDATIPVKGGDFSLRLYIDAVDYWALDWAQVRDFSGITVDVETAAIIQRTVNFDMQGVYNGSLGSITAPGAGAAFWPTP